MKLLEQKNDQLESELLFSIHSVESLTLQNLELKETKLRLETQMLQKQREYSMQILTQVNLEKMVLIFGDTRPEC